MRKVHLAKASAGLIDGVQEGAGHCFTVHIIDTYIDYELIPNWKNTYSKMHLGLEGKVVLLTGNIHFQSPDQTRQTLTIIRRWHERYRANNCKGISQRRRHGSFLRSNRSG